MSKPIASAASTAAAADPRVSGLRRERGDGEIEALDTQAGNPEHHADEGRHSVAGAGTDEQRAMLDLYFSQTAFGRPYLVSPDVPADRIKALRVAFESTIKDAKLQEEAKKIWTTLKRKGN